MDVILDVFEGPLDLLLNLIQKHEIDIRDIPIAELTRQYLEVIYEAREISPDMDSMSEFLLMAATLLEIKSKMLLSKDAEKENEDDPRETLVRQLIAYEKCKLQAGILQSLPNIGASFFKKPEYPLMSKVVNFNPEDWLSGITPEIIHDIYMDVKLRKTRKIDTVRSRFGKVVKDKYTIEEKIRKITNELKKAAKLRLSKLFAECTSKEECVVTFLALLEMIRRRQVTVRQRNAFGEVEILKCPA